MLNLNSPAVTTSTEEEDFKVLVLDPFTRDIIAPLLKVNELRKYGITLHLMLGSDRQPISDVPAIYFVAQTEQNVKRIALDVSVPLYDTFHLNFSSPLPRPFLEELASECVKTDSISRVNKVYDQYLGFVSLEKGLFSLAQPRSYVKLNDPAAKDTDVEQAVAGMVEGIFSVLVSLGVVPIIRCPKGGAAEMVASELERRLRDHLVTRNNLFTEASQAGGSFQRPLLCLFDRNFELAVAVQHGWTYQPLVHEIIGLHLNRVTVKSSEPSAPGAPPATKAYDLEHQADWFWSENCTVQFPKVAESVEAALSKYKQGLEEVNRKTQMEEEEAASGLSANTQNLMSAVNSLPELTERKRVIDKHTNIATQLLGEIKARGIDAFYHLEEEMLTSRVDKAEMMELLSGSAKGTAEDKLRLAIVYLLACETVPPQADLDSIEAALKDAGADTAAFSYVKRMRSLDLTNQQGGASALAGPAAGVTGLDWADKLYNQGVSAVTKGVKNLLSDGHMPAVARVLEVLMESKPSPEVDGYALFDPKVAKGGAAGEKAKGPFKEAIVFMIGGGNYLEYHSLLEMAGRNPQAPKSIVYGTTDLVTGKDFTSQLEELGKKMMG